MFLFGIPCLEIFIYKISNSFWECDYLVTKYTHSINNDAYFLVVYNKTDLMIYLKILFPVVIKNSLFSIFFVITYNKRTIQKMKDEVKNIKHGGLVQTSILKYFSSS